MMEANNWKKQGWITASAAVLIVLAVCSVNLRTERNIRLMAEACERLGTELQIERISSFGSVQGRCGDRSEH